MREKSKIYEKEQNEVRERLLKIINENTFILYEFDNDIEKKEQIESLLPDIKKFFSINNSKLFNKNIKRCWLSIIKYLLKNQYSIITTDYRINNIRTKRFFIKKNEFNLS